MRLSLIILVLMFIGVLAFFGRVATKNPPLPKPETTSELPNIQPIIMPSVNFIDPARGNPTAPVTIIEYGDYLCQFCADLEPVLRDVLSNYPTQVRLVWKDFPNDGHNQDATRSAEAARCAHEEGKYWEYHDLLFSRVNEFGLRPHAEWAQVIGLSREKMKQCLESHRTLARVRHSLEEALALRLTGAPSLFINGQPFAGRTFDEFKRAIDALIQ